MGAAAASAGAGAAAAGAGAGAGAGWCGWREAWERALYGPDGFYRRHGPEAHFRTSASAGPLLGEAVHRLAGDVDAQLGHPAELVLVDVGAGDGSLLRAVAGRLSPDERSRWRLHGVDLRDRPAGLPPDVAWSTEPPTGLTGLLVAHELLDDVPLDVVEATTDGPRLVEVDALGHERAGAPPGEAALRWLAQWWPLAGAEPGDRAEVGDSRDRRWADLVARVRHGAALAVDYAHTGQQRQAGAVAGGTLTGYRGGRQVAPVPDGSCDLTAHVALDSCAAAGLDAGAAGSLLLDQRTALLRLGVDATRPPLDLAHSDPGAYVRALAGASAAAELLQRGGLGDFGWLLQSRGCRLPQVLEGTDQS